MLVCHVHLGETVAFKKTRNFVHDIFNENLLQCSWQQTLLWLALITHIYLVLLQKWIRSRLSFLLDDGAQESKCLDTDSENRKLVVKLCDSTKESQHWTY